MSLKDPEKRRAYNKQYRLDHLEELKHYDENRKEQHNEVYKLKRRAAPEKNREYAKKWNKDNPMRVRTAKLARVFWTPEMYEQAKTAQEGRCAICNEVPESTLHADHDHATSKPRALLCRKHNMMLGLAGDSPDILEAAAAYLRKWSN
jgi:hypothetical protein